MTSIRLLSYLPNGASQGPLPQPLKAEASYPLNDTGGLALDYSTDAARAELLGQPQEVATEVSWDNGVTWTEPPNGRYLYLSDGRDPVQGDPFSVTLPSYVWRMSKAVVPFTGLNSEGNRPFANASPGSILNTLLSEAQARGALAGFAWDFTAAKDSAGVDWPARTVQTIAYAPMMTLQAVLQGFVDAGLVDYRTQGRTLQLYASDTAMATDRTTGAVPVSVRPIRDLLGAPFRRTWEALADVAYVQGDNNANAIRTNPTALKPWGRQETGVSASGVTDPGTLATVGDAALANTDHPRSERTLPLGFAQAPFLPLRDYRPGEWILAPNEAGTIERVRVRQITLTRDENGDGGNLVVNDRLVEQDILVARRLAQLTAGATAGGTGSTPSGGVGNDILAPAQVTGLGATSSVYIGADKFPRAQITLDWNDVTTNADGTAATDVDHYEVHRRPQGDAAWTLVGEVNTSLWSGSPYEPGSAWEFRVRAVDSVYNRGTFSAVVAIAAAGDTVAPKAPGGGFTVTSDLEGLVRVVWDGKDLDGGGMPADLARVEVHASGVSNPTFQVGNPATLGGLLYGAGTVTVSGLAKGSTQYLRLLAVDTSGNVSAQSVQRSVSVSKGTDGAAPTIPNGWAPSLAPLGVGALAVSWPPVISSDDVSYDVFLGVTTQDGTVSANLYGTSQGTSMPLWNLPDGTPLSPTVDYYVAVKPRDPDGVAAGVGQAGPVGVRQAGQDLISGTYIYGNRIESQQIKSGTLDAALAIVQEIFTATSGRRISLSSANGFQAVDDTGNVVMSIPTDMSADVQINADLIAQSVTALGKVAMRALGNEVAQGASMVLRAGTSAPVSPPTVSQSWNVTRTRPNADAANFAMGVQVLGADYLITYGGLHGVFRVDKCSRTTGAFVSTDLSYTNSNYTSVGAIKIGSAYYSLGTYKNRYKENNPFYLKWYVSRFTQSGGVWSVASEWEFAPTSDLRDNRPTIGVNPAGTGILMAWVRKAAGNVIRLNAYDNPDSSAATTTIDTALSHGGHLGSVSLTAADFGGAARWVVTTQDRVGGDLIYGFTSTGARDQGVEWPTANSDVIAGVAWDPTDSLWKQTSRSDNTFTIYDGTTWQTPAAPTRSVTLSNTWVDRDPLGDQANPHPGQTAGTHESAQGPRAAVVLKKRARLVVTCPPIPTDSNNANRDDATAAGFYAGAGGGTQATQWLQVKPADGVRSVTLVRLALDNTSGNNPNPPLSGNFPNGTPAVVTSDDGMYFMDGFGDVKARTLTYDIDGTDSGRVSGWATAGTTTGWTDQTRILRADYDVVGRWVEVRVQTSTSAAYTGTASGNYGNHVVLGGLPAAVRPVGHSANGAGRWDDAPVAVIMDTAGALQIVGGPASKVFAADSPLFATLVYLRG